MANPNVLNEDTILYCPAEPQGRKFPKGETWPGDAWSFKPGGETVGANTTTEALKDLIAAQEQIEALQGLLDNANFSLANAAKAKEDAEAKVAGLEQAVRDAEAAKGEAESVAAGLTAERDRARAELARINAALPAADAPADPPAPTEAGTPATDAMRAEYAELTGKTADGRWGADTLAEKLQEARATAAAAT